MAFLIFILASVENDPARYLHFGSGLILRVPVFSDYDDQWGVAGVFAFLQTAE
jgi:hypothetical protein